jgi:hypothetical protein
VTTRITEECHEHRRPDKLEGVTASVNYATEQARVAVVTP